MGGQKKVLIIGLDGATWKVLDKFIMDGYMPNLANLRSCSAWGVLKSTIPYFTPTAWSSLITGCNPGKTGIYGFARPVNANWHITKTVSSVDIKVPTFWEMIVRENKKSICINIPMTYPPKKINGFFVGWGRILRDRYE